MKSGHVALEIFFLLSTHFIIIIDKLQEPILTGGKEIIINVIFTLQYSAWGCEFNLATAGKIIELKWVGVTNAFKTSLEF